MWAPVAQIISSTRKQGYTQNALQMKERKEGFGLYQGVSPEASAFKHQINQNKAVEKT